MQTFLTQYSTFKVPKQVDISAFLKVEHQADKTSDQINPLISTIH